MLYKILSSVQFLACQGLVLRGSGGREDSNYIQLMKLRGMDDSQILDWIGKKSNKYTNADMQNEMLIVMSLKVLREIVSKIHNTFFYTVMVDETTDCSNVVLVIRWVDE